MKKTIQIFLVTILLTSCATERYGRLSPVTEVEARELTCRELNIEEAKAKEFMNNLHQEVSKFKTTDVLAFFGDLGIGNIMEVHNAEKTGTKRLVELSSLKIAKGCK